MAKQLLGKEVTAALNEKIKSECGNTSGKKALHLLSELSV